jgi:hypothetical protein
MDSTQIINTIGTDIDKFFAQSKRLISFSWQDKVNYLNQLGKKHSIAQLSTDYPKEFEKLKNYLNKKLQDQSISESIMKKILKEENLVIQTPKPILNYEDSDVIKAIKKAVDGYSGFTLKNIQSNADQYYNVEVLANFEDGSKDLEANRFVLAQKLHKFRLDLMSDLSKELPIINVNIGAYKFVKGEEQVHFVATVLIGNTNNKDWVTGNLKKEVKDLNESLNTLLNAKKKS